jgi:hypothetical protein
MQSTSIPTKFGIPFANGAGAGYIRPIPTASQIGIQAGAASLTDGFPPVTFISVDAGGTPPWGADWNGVLNQSTAWNRWQAAGGPVRWDSAFNTTIGGYPAGAAIRSTSNVLQYWVSTVDNNTTNPDAGGANWVPGFLIGFTPVQQGTGIGQLTNTVKIGWSGSALKATVDSTDLGALATQVWSLGEFYTQSQSDVKYVTYTYLVANYHTASFSDATYATYAWVNANFYTASYSAANFATYSWVNANFALINAFTNGGGGSNSFQNIEGGIRFQWGVLSFPCTTSGLDSINFSLPSVFPNACIFTITNWTGNNPPNTAVGVSSQPAGAGAIQITLNNGIPGFTYGVNFIAIGF